MRSFLWLVVLLSLGLRAAPAGTNSLCERGASSVTLEMWVDDSEARDKTTPHALVFENVLMRGNIVLMCDIDRMQARAILCTFNRGCQRIPELAFPGLRIANEKEGWVEGDDSYIYGEEKGCLAHYAATQHECNLDLPSIFGINLSPCASTLTVAAAVPAAKSAVYSGVIRLNGMTLRHVMRSSNIGHYWNEDFFHFYRILTPSYGATKHTIAKNASEVGGGNNTAPGDRRSGSASSKLGVSSSGIFSLKESALSAFRATKSNKPLSSPPSHILMDSIIDYRNWSATAWKYEGFFSEGRGAADSIPNSRDLDGAGLNRVPRTSTSSSMDAQSSVVGYYRQNKEWVRSLVYCSVIQPFQLVQSPFPSNSTESRFSRNLDADPSTVPALVVAAPAAGTTVMTSSSSSSSRRQHFFHMQDSKVAYSIARLVVQPFERCIYHGKVEPTANFEERKKRFSNLRADVHDCTSVNKTATGGNIVLLGNNKRWSNVMDLASRIQAAPGIKMPVKVIEKMPHTFREQAQLFASAKLLISTSSAALMNVPFMPFASTLVELVRFSKGETSLIKTFGMDAAVSQHIVIDFIASASPTPVASTVTAPTTGQGEMTLGFKLLRQKLCDRSTLQKLVDKRKDKYFDPMSFADMNVFCRNVTSSSQASSLKTFSAGIVSAMGGL